MKFMQEDMRCGLDFSMVCRFSGQDIYRLAGSRLPDLLGLHGLPFLQGHFSK